RRVLRRFVNLAQAAATLAKGCGRGAELRLERAVQSGFRAISDQSRDLHYLATAREQVVRRQIQAPAREIFQGRHSNSRSESRRKSRTRQSGKIGEAFDSPVMTWLLVHRRKRAADLLIRQAGEPTGVP